VCLDTLECRGISVKWFNNSFSVLGPNFGAGMMRFLLSVFAVCTALAAAAQAEGYTETQVAKYVAKFKDLAIEEQVRTGVPAAITLAQGIYETGSGSSPLAVEAKNHFGIKCKKDWTGETMLHDDDAAQECFRKYSTDRDSYIDHSNFLKNNRRYGFLFDIPAENYKDWAVGLRRAGYATNPAYSGKLITMVEKYDLQQYTLAAQKQIQVKNNAAAEAEKAAALHAASQPRNSAQQTRKRKTVDTIASTVESAPVIKVPTYVVETLYGLKGFHAKKGQRLLQASIDRDIRYQKLLELNDLDDEELPADMFIFTEKKYKRHPTKKSYVVQEGDDMVIVAQRTGMQLRPLLALNLLKINDTPDVGQRIFLQDIVSRAPKLRGETRPMLAKKETPVVPIAETTQIDKEAAASELAQEVAATQVVIPTTDTVVIPVVDPGVDAAVSEDGDAARLAAKAELDMEEFQRQQAEMANQMSGSKPSKEAEQHPANVDVQLSSAVVASTPKEPAAPIQVASVAAPEVARVEEPARPRPVSPSKYNEQGVSAELHKMKRIMDEVIYAAPPPPKPKVTAAPAPSPAPPKPAASVPKPAGSVPKPAVSSAKPVSSKPTAASVPKATAPGNSKGTTNSSTKPATVGNKVASAAAAKKPVPSTVAKTNAASAKPSATPTAKVLPAKSSGATAPIKSNDKKVIPPKAYSTKDVKPAAKKETAIKATSTKAEVSKKTTTITSPPKKK
jgi:hypothetical protein